MFHQHLRSQRRLSAYSANSAWSYEDHPIHANSHPTYPTFNTSRRPSACCSERSCELLSAEDTKDLWKCMLELQERYGCYNSARIDLAMGAGDEGINYMPNRFIIDTLNDSVIDFLPEEGWEMLDRFLQHNEASVKRKSSLKFWKKEN